jgi:sec-independent protein translocase protein TatB
VLDIGFFELAIVAIVGLLVIGPERLPSALRTGALVIGRIKRGMRDARDELERQIGADDIRQQLHNEDILARLEKTRQDINHSIHEPVRKARETVGTLTDPTDHTDDEPSHEQTAAPEATAPETATDADAKASPADAAPVTTKNDSDPEKAH